jgi:hypothetical protein
MGAGPGCIPPWKASDVTSPQRLWMVGSLLCLVFGCRNPDQDPPGGIPDKTAPIVLQHSQSATQVMADDTVTFGVTVQGEETGQRAFVWTASAGTLEEPSNTGTTSQVSWKAPPCVPKGTLVTVSVTVTNDEGLSTSQSFTLTPNSCPTPAAAAGDMHSLALRGDGSVWAWGDNANGQLGDETLNSHPTPVQVPGLNSVTAIATGSAHSLALRANGTVWAWGSNAEGQLGDGTLNPHPTAVQVPGLNNITAIAAGGSFSLALRKDGTVWAWGRNTEGELGDGSLFPRLTPVQVSGLTDVTAIAAGRLHSLAVRGDGIVWAWGALDGRSNDGSYSA